MSEIRNTTHGLQHVDQKHKKSKSSKDHDKPHKYKKSKLDNSINQSTLYDMNSNDNYNALYTTHHPSLPELEPHITPIQPLQYTQPHHNPIQQQYTLQSPQSMNINNSMDNELVRNHKINTVNMYINKIIQSIDWNLFNEIKSIVHSDINLFHDIVAQQQNTVHRDQHYILLLNFLVSSLQQTDINDQHTIQDNQSIAIDQLTHKSTKKSKSEGKRSSRSWSIQDENEVQQLRDNGLSFPEIAKQIGRTMGSIKKHYYKLIKPNHSSNNSHNNTPHQQSINNNESSC